MNYLMNKLDILAHKVFTSRKFLGALCLTIFSSLAMWRGKLPGDTWLRAIEWIWGTWVISQGAVDAAEKLAFKTVNQIATLPPKGQL